MRPVIENGLRLDLADLRRKCLFLPDGAQRQIGLSWTTNGETRASISMSYSTGEDGGWLRLRYRTQPYDQDEPIHVDEWDDGRPLDNRCIEPGQASKLGARERSRIERGER